MQGTGLTKGFSLMLISVTMQISSSVVCDLLEQGIDPINLKQPEKINPHMESNGDVRIDDMILSQGQYNTWIHPNERKGQLLKNYDWLREEWPNEGEYPTVPYNITAGDPKFFEAIEEGIKHWESHTCIRFRQKRDEDDKGMVEFLEGDKKECYSKVGRRPPHQPIYLGKGCIPGRAVVHEIGHAIGFYHEHVRPDRDDSLSVLLKNIEYHHRSNFYKQSTWVIQTYRIPIDFYSVMMYKPRAASANGGLTMVSKDPSLQGIMGAGNWLSHRDKLLINRLYECDKDWRKKCGLETNICENEGYVGKDCKCVCAPGTEGDKCQERFAGYYDHLLPACNRKITEGGTTIETPSSTPGTNDTWCMYHILAPENHHIKVAFSNFYLHNPAFCLEAYVAFWESKLEALDPTIKCGDIMAGKEYITQTNELAMFYFVPKESKKDNRFKAEVNFFSDQTGTVGALETSTPAVQSTTTKPTTATTIIVKPTTANPMKTTTASLSTSKIIIGPTSATPINNSAKLTIPSLFHPFLVFVIQQIAF